MRWGTAGFVFPCAVLLFAATAPRCATGQEPEEEKPRFEIDLEFRGNEELATADLRRAVSALVFDLRRRGVDEAAVEDAVYLVESYYRSEGFPEPAVQCTVQAENDTRFRLRFQIVEGPRTLLGKLEFRGNTHFEEAKLAECFNWSRRSAVRELLRVGQRVYSPEILEDGLACVEALYRYEGFAFVEVSSEVDADDKSAVRVRVAIEEGPRIRVESLRIDGVRAFDAGDVIEALQFESGVPFDPRLPLILKGRILDYYRTRGYRGAVVTTERHLDREKGVGHLAFHLVEGPVSRIRAVRVEGTRTTREGVVERYVRLRPGDLYNEDLVRRSYRGLIRSGLFESATIDIEPMDAEGREVAVVVKVEEKPRYAITPLVGYGSWEQLRGALVLEDRNLFGFGHRLRFEGGGSFKGEHAGARYLNPFFFIEDLSQDFSVSYERREQRSFASEEFGGETGFAYRFTDNLNTRAFYRLLKTDSVDVSTGIPAELTGDFLVSSLNLVATWDTRDRFLDPRRGMGVRAALEYAGDVIGSELEFLRPTLSTTWVQPLPWDLRLVLHGRTGIIAKLGDTTDIPIQERFFGGGDRTIRSFRQDRAGPTISGKPIGGEAFLLFNSELRIPLPIIPLLENLEAAIFGDVGTVNEDLSDYGGDRYFFAVGTGLRYNTPVGPLRIDFAFNPDQGPNEDLFEFHFALGYPF